MPTFISEFLSQLKNIWAQLAGGQRLMVAAVLLATVVGMGGLLYLSSRPDYEPIPVTGSVEENADIIRLFSQEGIDFRTDAAGNITVNSNYRDQANTLLVRENFIAGGGDSMKWLSSGTSVMQPKNISDYILLSRKRKRVEAQIAKLRGVRSALVSLNTPQMSVFMDRNSGRSPSASVLLTLSGAGEFRKLAGAAAGMVSKGLGIPRKDVLVTSHAGDSYSENENPAGRGGGGFTDLLRLEMTASNAKTALAQTRLNEVFPGKTNVQVVINYSNKIGSTRKTLVPDDKIIKSESKYTTSTKDRGKTSGGDPNVGTSSGSSAAGGAGTPRTESTQTQTRKEYESNIGSRTEYELAPEITKLRVSLLLDDSLAEKKDEIATLVKNLVGWDDKRDPEFAAVVTKFPNYDTPAEEGGGTLAMVKEYAPLAGQVLSVLLVLLFLKGLLKRQKPAPIVTTGAAAEEEEEEFQDPAKEIKRLRKEIERVVAGDPGSASRLLESWITEKADAS